RAGPGRRFPDITRSTHLTLIFRVTTRTTDCSHLPYHLTTGFTLIMTLMDTASPITSTTALSNRLRSDFTKSPPLVWRRPQPLLLHKLLRAPMDLVRLRQLRVLPPPSRVSSLMSRPAKSAPLARRRHRLLRPRHPVSTTPTRPSTVTTLW